MKLLDGREVLRKATSAVEAKTAAEVVVVVRRRSGTYRDAHYAFGMAFSLATLLALLYLPHEFPLWLFAVDLLASFVAASVAASLVGALGRTLVPAARRQRQVAEAARAAFYDKGVSRTSGRWGILVYASCFEQAVEILPDLGVDPAVLDDATRQALADAVAADDADAFAAALGALGARLEARYPRRGDDQNELDDDVDAAS